MPPKIAIAVFDAAVHHGPKTAVKLLQRALKVADDGEYGRITHGTLQSRDTNDTLELLLAQRAIYLTTCPAWPTYKLGWLKRLFNLARSNFA
jgi:lysozyme family protein